MGRGALSFKGDPSSRKRKRKSATEATSLHGNFDEAAVVPSVTNGTFQTIDNGLPRTPSDVGSVTRSIDQVSSTTPQQAQKVVIGRGKITVSGTVVTGYNTKFTDEVQVGDAIIVQNDIRIVTIRVSDVSLNISSPFTFKIAQPTSFSFICKPRSVQQDKEEMDREEKRKIQQIAADTERHQNGFSASLVSATSNDRGSSNTILYRERTEHGNYRIKQIKVNNSTANSGTSRSHMLTIRTKKTSDKYC